jgi:hypothetical protein
LSTFESAYYFETVTGAGEDMPTVERSGADDPSGLLRPAIRKLVSGTRIYPQYQIKCQAFIVQLLEKATPKNNKENGGLHAQEFVHNEQSLRSFWT